MAVTWTTQRPGNWSLSSADPASPWYDGGAQTAASRTPGSGGNISHDLVVIANGHALVCDASVVIGDVDAPASLAISTSGIGGTGALTVSPGVVLTIVSNVQQGNAAWSFAAGTSLLFSSNAALSWLLTDGSAQTAHMLSFNGTAGNRCAIRSMNAPGCFSKGPAISFSFSASYTDFTNIGTAVVSSVSTGLAGSACVFLLDHCRFTSCGPVQTATLGTGTSLSITNSQWIDSPSNANTLLTSSNAIGSGVRLVSNNVFDKAFGGGGNHYQDFTFTGNYFGIPLAVSSTAWFPWANFSNNYIHQSSSTGGNIAGEIQSSNAWNYWHVHNPSSTLTNVKPITMSGKGDVTISGMIFDFGNTDGLGDLITTPAADTPRTYTIANNLVLPNLNGESAGKLSANAGGPNSTIVVNHNTLISVGGPETGAVQYGENYRGLAGMVSSLRSNLVWTPPTKAPGYVMQQFNALGAGTLTVTNGSNLVVGTGTTFTTSLSVGDWLVFTADNTVYQIANISDNTNLTLTGNYGGTTGSGKTWKPHVKNVVFNSSFTAADYNCRWNLASGSDGVGYNSNTPGVTALNYTPGAHDVNLGGDPFVDRSRNIAAWAVFKGLALNSDAYQIKVDAATSQIKINPATMIADLVSWVKAGWCVKTPSLKAAGHDGADLGALPYVASGSVIPFLILTSGRAV